ncbi:hypothetical protein LguiA_025123 [Lonicera macranthoides]
MSDSSNWFFTYTKLRFFIKIRRFLKKSNKKSGPSDQIQFDAPIKVVEITKEDDWAVLQRSVKRLHFGNWEEKEVAVNEIKRLAAEDLKWRMLVAELGVVPPLVAMMGDEVAARRRLAVQTLLELANGSHTNKALMVEAGILSKLPQNIDGLEESTRHEFAELALLLSSLANTQSPLSTSKILEFVCSILDSDSSINTKGLCLGTLYNLSTILDNAGTLVTSGVLDTLLGLSSMKETSEKALATLGNLVVTLMGKKALENSQMVPGSLIEIMTWEEKPKCQELSTYILMILAHRSSAQRIKMAKAGIVSTLLEVALLSSPLAQKRALKLLQWFKDERQMKMVAHSGPQTRRLPVGSPVHQSEPCEGKRLMKKMVKQSLYKNMETITRRANGNEGSSNHKVLVLSSSSKSLPY